jgi:hypothetical protein
MTKLDWVQTEARGPILSLWEDGARHSKGCSKARNDDGNLLRVAATTMKKRRWNKTRDVLVDLFL